MKEIHMQHNYIDIPINPDGTLDVDNMDVYTLKDGERLAEVRFDDETKGEEDEVRD